MLLVLDKSKAHITESEDKKTFAFQTAAILETTLRKDLRPGHTERVARFPQRENILPLLAGLGNTLNAPFVSGAARTTESKDTKLRDAKLRRTGSSVWPEHLLTAQHHTHALVPEKNTFIVNRDEQRDIFVVFFYVY